MAIEQPSTRLHGHEVSATAAEGTSDPGMLPLTTGDIPAIVQQISEMIANQTGNGLPSAETCQRAASHSTSEEEGRQPPPSTTTCQGEETTIPTVLGPHIGRYTEACGCSGQSISK